jgi:tetratricopeptide (TPR) repeat protein
MMQSSNDESALCSFCKQRPATEEYTHAGDTEKVCATCLDQEKARDALEERLLYIVQLEMNEQYDEALACLDEIEEANRHLDHHRWVARSIAMHRSSILFDAGRYEEVERACEAWAQLGFATVDHRWMHGFYTAQALEALGRPREALAALEEALSHRDRRFLPSARYVLVALVELCEKLGQAVDAKWLGLAEEIAGWYGIDVPVRDSVGEAILALDEITRSMEKKHLREQGLQ